MTEQNEIEFHVLSGLLSSKAFLARVKDISAADFVHDDTRVVFQEIVAQLERGLEVDYLSIGERFSQPEMRKAVYGLHLLGADQGYIKLLKNATSHRLLTQFFADSYKRSAEKDCDLERLLNETLQKTMLLQREALGDIGMSAQKVAEGMSKARWLRQSRNSVSSGIEGVDMLTGGFLSGSLTYLAARTGIGKTTLLMQFASHALLEGKNVLFFSLEMEKEDITAKLACLLANVPYSAWFGKNLKKHEIVALDEMYASGILDRLTLEYSRPTINQFKGLVRRYVADGKCDICFVDYLTKVVSDRHYSNHHHEVDAVSKGFQDIAKETYRPLVSAVQLTKAAGRVVNNVVHSPVLSDIREAGEEDADTVMLMHRPDAYGDNRTRPGLVELSIAKNRLGVGVKTIGLSYLNETYKETPYTASRTQKNYAQAYTDREESVDFE